jgi:formylmethanofuran dehydrogenase subunit E
MTIKLDEEILKDFTESIRRFRAAGMKAKEIKATLFKAWNGSGLNQYKTWGKSFEKHIEEALKRYEALEVKTETCQNCGEEVPVCVQCSVCGKRVCKSCYAGTDFRNLNGPKNYCKACAESGDLK